MEEEEEEDEVEVDDEKNGNRACFDWTIAPHHSSLSRRKRQLKFIFQPSILDF